MARLTRRKVLEMAGASALAIGGSALFYDRIFRPLIFPESDTAIPDNRYAAMYYDSTAGKAIVCSLCSRNCTVQDGKRGFCRSRENVRGKYYSLVYGNPVAVHIDPIEKLPMKHVFPGTDSLSVGTACCNFTCLNCINNNIAIQAPEDVESVAMTPEEIVQMAVDHDVPMVSFTYNEPTIAYEYMRDVFKLARGRGLRTTFHTNGYMKPAPARDLLKFTDSVVVDLKAFTPELYHTLTAGDLSPVQDFMETVRQAGVWLEIVNLIIPGYNDDVRDIQAMCAWVNDSISPDVPVHFSRFFPTYRLDKLSPTPVTVLENAHRYAKSAHLNYVYLDNLPGHQYSNTFCPGCGEMIIERKEYIATSKIVDGKCPFCGQAIPGLWDT